MIKTYSIYFNFNFDIFLKDKQNAHEYKVYVKFSQSNHFRPDV